MLHVAAARRAHRRGIAGAVYNLGELLDLLPVRALVWRAGVASSLTRGLAARTGFF